MKRFRDIRQSISEETGSFTSWRVGPVGGDNSVDTPDVAVFDIAHPESIRRINAFLGEAGQRAAIDPTSVVRQIQRKLSIIGLQFNLSGSQLKGMPRNGSGAASSSQDDDYGSWTEEYNLSYLGGRYGCLNNEGKIGYDDNISHRIGHGLKLRIQYRSLDTGMIMVNPKIVPEHEELPKPPVPAKPVGLPKFATMAQLRKRAGK